MSNPYYNEHERNMENPWYKKGFEYVFDHYGVPEKPSEELIRLRKKEIKDHDIKIEYEKKIQLIKRERFLLNSEIKNLKKARLALQNSRRYYKQKYEYNKPIVDDFKSTWFYKLFRRNNER